MSEELKPCPFCGSMPVENHNYSELMLKCPCGHNEARLIGVSMWQTRPIEDALRRQLSQAISGMNIALKDPRVNTHAYLMRTILSNALAEIERLEKESK